MLPRGNVLGLLTVISETEMFVVFHNFKIIFIQSGMQAMFYPLVGMDGRSLYPHENSPLLWF